MEPGLDTPVPCFVDRDALKAGGKGWGLAILIVVLQSHSREVLWVSEFLQGIWIEADPYLVEKGLCD